MICKLIGIGAAGNKAAITAVENDIISIENTMLINSTLKDIPAEYKNTPGAVIRQYSNAYGGCGKQRDMSFELANNDLQNNVLGFDEFLHINQEDEAELVILVTSTEGGTGSGSTPIVAKYIRHVLGIPVHVFGIAGFDDDARGMRNTVEFFQEMESEFTVECIRNAKFLSETNGNKLKAENLANIKFCEKIAVLMGLQIRDSAHNIDPTDLLKVSTEEGYMIIETCTFGGKIKNKEQFREALVDTLDNSKALDIDTKAISRLAVIINIREENTDWMDYEDILIDRFGVPYEKFEHIQHETGMPEFISIIATGMKMPTDEVESIYKKYQDSISRVNYNSDNFFATIKDKTLDPNDNKFNLKKKKTKVTAAEFFKNTKTVERKPTPVTDPLDQF